MNLQRRVEKLEAAVAGRTREHILILRFIVPGNSTSGPSPTEAFRITCRDHEWHRQEGETEEAFIERAKVEARERLPGGMRSFICYPDENAGGRSA